MKNFCLLLVLHLILGISIGMAQDYPFKVDVYGKGDPVFLVPGFSCPAQVWEETITALAPDYELHVFTLAGFGEVNPVKEFPWLSQIKTGMEQYIKDKKLSNIKFVGHSMGGTLGLWLAADHQTSFAKVISVDGLPAMGAMMFPNYNPDNFAYDSPYNKQTLDMSQEQFAGMATQFANMMTLNDTKKPTIADWIKKADRKTYVYGYTDLLKLDLREQLSSITTPVTVIAATKPYGKETVKNTMDKQFENLQNYELILAENAAHFIMFDSKEWFQETLKKELSL